MRTFAIFSLMLFVVPPRVVSAADGHIEIRKHRFSKHTGQQFERLVLEFKREGTKGLPNVRVGADGTAGEVSVQVTDVNLKGTIPEAGVNDSFVPKSKLLGPISVSMETTRSGFTLRTFLKSPKAKVEAFWLENPSRLVIDAFGENSPRATGVKATGRAVASRHGKKPLTTNDFVCFPSQAAVGLKVTFQSKGRKGNTEGLPVAVEGAPKGPGESESVVCYPKHTQVVAAILFDPPSDSEPSAQSTMEMKMDGEPSVSQPMSAAPIKAPRSRVSAKPAINLKAPANSIHNKSPQSLAFEQPKSVALPSAEAKPSTNDAAPVQATKEASPPAAALTLPPIPSLPSIPASPSVSPEPARTPTATSTKPSLNLPLSLPSLPQATGSAYSGTAKLSLPPPQQMSQAPALLPPIPK